MNKNDTLLTCPCFFSSAPPTFSDTPPQYVEAKEGGSITLTCTAFGNPKPSVSWLRDGNLMVNSAKYKVLHIPPLCVTCLADPEQKAKCDIMSYTAPFKQTKYN